MRSKIILAAALIMGLVTTLLFFEYMKQFDEASAAGDSLVTVVAAKQEIKPNTKISAGMLETIEIPAQGAHAQALKNPRDAEEKVSAAYLMPGEVLLPHHLKDQKEEALFVSKKVRDGYRAISVGVNLVQSVSNLIEPGDFVDVVETIEDKPSDKFYSSIILENVRVLAIGRRMVEAGSDTPYVEYASVTLEVKPADGVKIINADEEGIVSLMLHSRVVDSGDKGNQAQTQTKK